MKWDERERRLDESDASTNSVDVGQQKRLMAREFKSQVSTNMPISMIQRIEDFRQRHRFVRKNDAMLELFHLGLYLESKLGTIDNINNEELETLQQQIEKGQVVDYIATLDENKFRILADIMKDEEATRKRNDRQIKWK